MTGLITADDAADLLADMGQPVTLTRIGSPNVSVTVQAVVIRVAEQVIAGNVAQFRRRVTIGSTEIVAASWPGPPQRGDQIVAGGRTMTVQGVRTAMVNDETVIYDLDTLGG